ncbi:PQQ-binding-like beta-propeller repeat protein [Actinoplanes sp. NPDC049316]|uniref:outer membrane protein assembly factor BamB family protein n=1 Tax=Actinoplanes sp. NPDC049316 TaxID=3154727 RepID=UPI0034242E91
MPDAVPLIDLDLAPPPPRAEPALLRRRLAPPRAALIAALPAVLLLTMTAATPPAPALVPVLSAGGTAAAAFTLGPAALYTATFGQNPDSESGVRRYDLPGGAQVWATALPQNVQSLRLEPQSGVLLARSGSDPRMTFLDAADGTVLWRLAAPGISAVTMVGGKVLLRTDLAGDRMELKLADARTGAPLWTRTLDGNSELRDDALRGRPPRRIVVLGRDGHVTTLDLADGRVLGEGELGVRLPAEETSGTGVDVSGDEVYVSRRDEGRVSLTAYRLPALTLTWQVQGGLSGTVYDCGRVLCLADGRRVSALDRADGSVLWSSLAWGSAGPTRDGRLIAATGQDDPETAEIDPRSGVVLRPLGHTFFVGDAELRGDTTIPGRTWVRVTGSDGAAHTVGSLDTAAPYGCEASGPYLACPTTAGPTGVWRLPLT